jgi:hypothetical protein
MHMKVLHRLCGNDAVRLNHTEALWFQGLPHHGREAHCHTREARGGVLIEMPNIDNVAPRHDEGMANRGWLEWEKCHNVRVPEYLSSSGNVLPNNLAERTIIRAYNHW